MKALFVLLLQVVWASTSEVMELGGATINLGAMDLVVNGSGAAAPAPPNNGFAAMATPCAKGGSGKFQQDILKGSQVS